MSQLSLTPISVNLDVGQAPKVVLDKREIEFVACREQKIPRVDWFKGEKYFLTFSHAKGAIDQARVKANQCMFLKGHNGWFWDAEELGQLKSTKVENEESLIANVKIGGSTIANEYWANVERDVIPGVSIEANVTKLTVIKKAKYEEDDTHWSGKRLSEPAELLAEEWELMALSSVSIPAIVGAGARKKLSQEESPFPLLQLSLETGYEWLEDFNDDGTKKKIIVPVKLGEKKHMSDEQNSSNANDQLVTENRDLKLQLAEANKALKAETEEKRQQELTASYWKLRNQALALYSVDNKLTLEDFQVDFSEDPQVDLEKFLSLSAETAKLELLGIERDLNRASRRKPIERVQRAKDKVKLNSEEIESSDVDDISRDDHEESDTEVDDFFASHKMREIGRPRR